MVTKILALLELQISLAIFLAGSPNSVRPFAAVYYLKNLSSRQLAGLLII